MAAEQNPDITLSDRALLLVINEKLDLLTPKVDKLLAIWAEHEPILAAFRRGGVLAARTAARNGRRSGPV